MEVTGVPPGGDPKRQRTGKERTGSMDCGEARNRSRRLSSSGSLSSLPSPAPSPDRALDLASQKGIFGWTTVDGAHVPYLLRDDTKFVCVRMVEQTLLSRFPNNYPDELKARPPLMSQFATASEAKLLNEINTEHCDYEYGKATFTTKELIVRLADFLEFYTIVKRHFPSGRPGSKGGGNGEAGGGRREGGATAVDGGWLQVNNTVVPYVRRGPLALLPVSVIKYAADLLKDVMVEGSDASGAECVFLTEICLAAGLNFSFGPPVKLVELDLVRALSPRPVEVKQLPRNDPFSHANYQDEEETPGSAGHAAIAAAAGVVAAAAPRDAGTGGYLPNQAAMVGMGQRGGIQPQGQRQQHQQPPPQPQSRGFFPQGQCLVPVSGSPFLHLPSMPMGGAGDQGWFRPGLPHLNAPPPPEGAHGMGFPQSMGGFPPMDPANCGYLPPGGPPPPPPPPPPMLRMGLPPAQVSPGSVMPALCQAQPPGAEGGPGGAIPPYPYHLQGLSHPSQLSPRLAVPRSSPCPADMRAAPKSPINMCPSSTASTVIVHDASKIREPQSMQWPLSSGVSAPGMPPGFPPTGARLTSPWQLPPGMAAGGAVHTAPGLVRAPVTRRPGRRRGRQNGEAPTTGSNPHPSSQMSAPPAAVVTHAQRNGPTIPATITPKAPVPVSGRYASQQSSAAVPPPLSEPNRPAPRQPHPPSAAPVPSSEPVIEPLQFHGKTISCLVRPDGGRYILIEAIGRVFFPEASLEDFLFALKAVLGLSVGAFSRLEEDALIRFYGLQTHSLKCNQAVALADLEKHMAQLTFMFNRPSSASEQTGENQATPSPPRGDSETTASGAPSGGNIKRAAIATQVALKSFLGKRSGGGQAAACGGGPPATKNAKRLDDAINRLRMSKLQNMAAPEPTEINAPP